MQHIFEYIICAGEDTFRDKPFQEVDFLALAQFTYLKLKDFVPGMCREHRGITIRELACHPGNFQMVQENWFAKENWKLLQLMAESRRYGEIRVNCYAECFLNKYDIQFQAVTFRWERDSVCICFRGTDESVAGWKEDFNLALCPSIPGQELARIYLRKVAGRYPGKIYLAGHSKGGNLSLYAALAAGKAMQQRIEAVYDFDGPDGCLNMSAYNGLERKINKYVPRQSLVGVLLEQGITYKVVESDGLGIMQHNPYLWHIKEGQLVLCQERTLGSRMLSKFLNQKITSMKQTHRAACVEALFEMISYPGQSSLFRMGENWKNMLYVILVTVKEKAGKKKRKKQVSGKKIL